MTSGHGFLLYSSFFPYSFLLLSFFLIPSSSFFSFFLPSSFLLPSFLLPSLFFPSSFLLLLPYSFLIRGRLTSLISLLHFQQITIICQWSLPVLHCFVQLSFSKSLEETLEQVRMAVELIMYLSCFLLLLFMYRSFPFLCIRFDLYTEKRLTVICTV